jgi:hypothetical protein
MFGMMLRISQLKVMLIGRDGIVLSVLKPLTCLRKIVNGTRWRWRILSITNDLNPKAVCGYWHND